VFRKIAHRGNLYGRNIDRENHPSYIGEALNAGYECEIDVWNIRGNWMLGHDEPKYHVNIRWLDHPGLWLHCKNKDAFRLMTSSLHNVFWHETDVMAYTTRGNIWTTHWDMLDRRTVIMCLDEAIPQSEILLKIHGICSDYIGRL
jgi:hypothetical protein